MCVGLIAQGTIHLSKFAARHLASLAAGGGAGAAAAVTAPHAGRATGHVARGGTTLFTRVRRDAVHLVQEEIDVEAGKKAAVAGYKGARAGVRKAREARRAEVPGQG